MNRDVNSRNRRSPSCDTNRNTPSLLRLDSTGEVSSENRMKSTSRVNNMYNKTKVDNRDTACLQNINRKMSSLIQSASNYIGNFYPPQSVSNSLTTNSKSTDPFGYLADMFGLKPSPAGCNNFMQDMDVLNRNVPCKTSENNTQCTSIANQSQCTSPASCQSIFGAIHSRFISPKDICHSNMGLQTEQKYIPPHKRMGMAFGNENEATRTPYNARLFEKSRQCQKPVEPSKPQVVLQQTSCQTHKPPVMPQELHACENNSRMQSSEEPVIDIAETSCTPMINIENRAPTPTHVIVQDENSETDWFDYPCDIKEPLTTEQADDSLAKPLNVECSKTEKNSDPEQNLHSWFSVESDNDVSSVSSSQVKTAENAANTVIHNDEKCTDGKDVRNIPICVKVKLSLICDNARQKGLQTLDSPQKTSPSCQILKQENATSEVSECAEVETHCEKSEKPATCDRIAVLYNRQSGKKSRPSKKKRTRHKAQQNESETCKSTLKPGSAVHPSSPVSCFLGVTPDICVNVHSFQFICDIDDSVSDWSDTDSDFDENFSSLDDDELGLRCNDFGAFGLINISCDIPNSPEKESPPAPTSSALDAVNKSWQQSVADIPTPNDSDRKVYFAETQQLATVHPIIAWRYAYAAARKGPWEEFARDRARFQRRLQDCATILDPILAHTHRDKVFTERFCNID